MADRRVIIVGGGLAGMTAAWVLARRKIPVTIVECGSRLGGKAGADIDAELGYIDHGYHVFPGWYRNTRGLLKAIGAYDDLVDIDRFWYLRPWSGNVAREKWYEDEDSLFEFLIPSTVSGIIHNMRSGLSSMRDSLFSLYYHAELFSERFASRAYLDRISTNGFLRSRYYASEGMAALQAAVVLQSSSIPNYQVSAMSIQRVGLCWMEDWLASTMPWLTRLTRIPQADHAPCFFSILDGNLQEKFIDPFERVLVDLGVEIRKNTRIERIKCERPRVGDDGFVEARSYVTALELGDGSTIGDADDAFVIATPHMDTSCLLDDEYYRAERTPWTNLDARIVDVDGRKGADGHHRPLLAEMRNLTSVPMAALQLHFDEKVPGIEREHVMFLDSAYSMSFVDVSSHWKELGSDATVLCVIAANFESLRDIEDEDVIVGLLWRELCRYVPTLGDYTLQGAGDPQPAGKRVRYRLQSNRHAPLFINTIGSWRYRPTAHTRLRNMYVSGDYCRSEADLTTMESAVMSGLNAADAVLVDRGDHPGDDLVRVRPRKITKRLARLSRAFMMPGVLVWSAGEKTLEGARRLLGKLGVMDVAPEPPPSEEEAVGVGRFGSPRPADGADGASGTNGAGRRGRFGRRPVGESDGKPDGESSGDPDGESHEPREPRGG